MATKRKDGRWQEKFTYEGKVYTVYASSKKDLPAKKLAKFEELKKGTDNRNNPTLDSYYETFTDFRRNKVKESTIRSQTCQFRDCADVRIGETTLGQMRIRNITYADCKQVQTYLSEHKSTETTNNCMAHLSHVFRTAIDDEILNRNPCHKIEDVRRTEPKAQDTYHRALTTEETKVFFENAKIKNSFYLNHFKLMISAGIRIGELGALSLSDFDFKALSLFVHKT